MSNSYPTCILQCVGFVDINFFFKDPLTANHLSMFR